jgi:aspartate/methionine/tyrosine aminotransferase
MSAPAGFKLHGKLEGLQPSLIRSLFDAAPKGAIQMGLGMPDLPVPQAISDAAMREAQSRRAPYSPNAGWGGLREKIVEMYARWAKRGPELGSWYHPEGVVVTAGAQEALYTALASLVGPGDDVLVPDPGYPGYGMILQTLGARAVPYRLTPEDEFRPTVKALGAAITNATRAVILASPSNPTGVITDIYELRAICDFLQGLQIPWVSDEVYDRYTYNEIFASPSAFSEGGIVVSSLSKSVNLMGWRLGWLIAPREHGPGLTRVHQAITTCASTLSQAAASEALDGMMERGAASAEITENLAKFWDRRDKAVGAIERLGLRHAPADGAFYLWVEVAPTLEAHKLPPSDLELAWDLVRNHGLVIVPGRAFGAGGEGWVRLSYACDRADEGLRRFAKGLGF